MLGRHRADGRFVDGNSIRLRMGFVSQAINERHAAPAEDRHIAHGALGSENAVDHAEIGRGGGVAVGERDGPWIECPRWPLGGILRRAQANLPIGVPSEVLEEDDMTLDADQAATMLIVRRLQIYHEIFDRMAWLVDARALTFGFWFPH
jgi:hypothetical protein